jgi:hypothetical protein
MTPSFGQRNPLYLRKLRRIGSSLDFDRKKTCGVPGSARDLRKSSGGLNFSLSNGAG